MANYNTTKVNPSCPIVKLEIGDLNLTLENSPEMAKYIFSFSMTRSAEDSSNDCVFRLFDETALMLEYAILQGYESVSFQYGMDESNISKKYHAIIKDYNLEFTGGGNIILDLQVTVAGDMSSDESCEYSNNPGEAFKTVCKEEGWTVGEFTATKSTEKKALLRTAQTATDFIKDVLVPDAVSIDGKNGYYFWTDTDSKTGKTVASFTPKGDLTTATDYSVYEIVIGGGNGREGLQCESVISFEPSFNGLFYNFFNPGGVMGTTVPPGTAVATTTSAGGTTSTSLVGGKLATENEFSKAVFVGDSLFVGLDNAVSGINVLATGGEAVHQGMERYTSKIIATQAPVVILDYGVNDAGHNNTDLFIRKYTKFINDIKAGIPGVKIYVNKIFEGDMSIATSSVVKACLKHVPEYNQALMQIVQSTGVGLIDATNLDYKSYYTSDGIHFKSSFYKLWYDEMHKQVVGTQSAMATLQNRLMTRAPIVGPDLNRIELYVWATRDCGLYEGTSRETKMIAKIYKGRKLTVIGETPSWYQVQYTEKLSGYILKSSLTKEDPKLGLDDVHNSIEAAQSTQSTSSTTGSTAGSSITSAVVNAISNGGVSQPGYQLEVPTIEELTNEIIDPYVSNGIKRRIGSSTYSSAEMGRVAEFMWKQSQLLANTAQLTLRGDATISTMAFLAIVVMTPDGFFHHSSGLYQILEISDDIDGGEYTTTLNLVKLGMSINEDGTISVKDPNQMYFQQNSGVMGGTTSTGGPTSTTTGTALTAGGGIDTNTLRSVLDRYNGAGYSQAKRTGPNYYDCSSLVNAVMGDLGISVNWGTTAVGVEKVGSGQWGTVVWSADSGQTLTKDMIPSGAVFVYNNSQGHHTGIFVDSQQMFHASNPKSGVLYGKTDYYVDFLNKMSTRAYVVVPPASGGTPVKNSGIKSRIN